MTERELLLEAMGADPASGIIGPSGRMIGRMADMQTFEAWRNDLGLTTDEVLTVIREVMTPKRDGPPSTFSYFTQAMQRFAGDKAKPKLTPIEGASYDRHSNSASQRPASTAAGRAHQGLIAGFARALSEQQE